MTDCLYNIWNHSKSAWASATNFSTNGEAFALLNTIQRQIKGDRYEVRERPFGTIQEIYQDGRRKT